MLNPNPLDDELREWKSHPFTQRYFNFLWNLEEAAKRDWSHEHFVGDTLDKWALENAKALGAVKALQELQAIEMQDIIDAEKEANEQVRNQSSRLDSAG